MSDKTRCNYLKGGRHSAAMSFAVPGSLTDVVPEGTVIMDPQPKKVERNLQRGDGGHYGPKTVGKKTEGISDFTTLVHGLSGLANNGVDADSLSHGWEEQAFETLFGNYLGSNIGDRTSGTPGSGTTIEMDGDPATLVAGGGALFRTASAINTAREIVSQADENVVVHRNFFTELGVAEDPAANEGVRASRTYRLETNSANRPLLFLEGEGDSHRVQIMGAACNLSFTAPEGDILRANFSGWKFHDSNISPEIATTSPTFTEPTRGVCVETVNAIVTIDDTVYQAAGFELDLGLKWEYRAGGGPNGNWGLACVDAVPTMKLRLNLGGLTSPAQLNDTGVSSMRNDTAKDITVQFGTGFSATGDVVMFRMPNAHTTAFDIGDANGLQVLDLTFMGASAADNANAAGDYPLRMHVFG